MSHKYAVHFKQPLDITTNAIHLLFIFPLHLLRHHHFFNDVCSFSFNDEKWPPISCVSSDVSHSMLSDRTHNLCGAQGGADGAQGAC